jgi:alkanesulfonate monooxygenase SsuD/methylene tetrahydromethanopterin reductase-like flavin-dependent oxidoreductase (luciferase family)
MRLGVMGVVTPWYEPARIVEEIGMLDHLTGGRLEIGTATGVPQELARLGITMEEARERNREALDIIDAALAGDVVTYRGKRFVYENLRLLPRPAQARPPRWTTVVSADSARHAARRGSKISTGFNTTEEIKALFDAYRAEAKASGFEAGPDHLALRRRIVIARSRSEAEEMSRAVRARFMAFAAADTRLKKGALPDAPKKQGDFSLSEDEFIAGPPDVVAEEIIKQCRRIGAGHFLAVLHWGAPFDEVAAAHELFGREVAHALRAAGV